MFGLKQKKLEEKEQLARRQADMFDDYIDMLFDEYFLKDPKLAPSWITSFNHQIKTAARTRILATIGLVKEDTP